MERLNFQSEKRVFVPELLPIGSVQEQRVITKRKNNSLLNVIHRVKSFKLHRNRLDEKLSISISFCLKNLNFQGATYKFRVKASVN